MLAFLIGTAFNFMVTLPFFLVCRKYGWNSLLNLSYQKLGRISYVFAVVFFGLFLCTCTSTVVLFEDFLSSTVLKDSSRPIIILLLIGASVYGAFLGIEALGRFANIVFVLLSSAILIILLSVFSDIDIANLGGFEFSNSGEILKIALEGVFSNTGLLTVVLLAPTINKNHTKAFCFWNLLSIILVEIIVFSVGGLLGEYAQNKEYPYYNTATIGEISIFRRLDIVYVCVWILVAFVKATYYLIFSKNVLDTFLHQSARKYSLFICIGIITVFSLIFSIHPVLYEYMQKLLSSGIIVGIVLVLPLLIILFGGKKREKN